MKIVKLLILLCLSQSLYGQRASRVLQASGLSFPHGFNAISTPNHIYFNALHPNAGFQLFEMKDERITQVTSFKQKLKKKDEPEDFQGAQTSNYAWFNNRLYFFATGKGVESGIYTYDQSKVRLVIACKAMSNGFANQQNEKLITQVAVANHDSLQYFHISIDPHFKVNRMKVKSNTLCTELKWFNGQLYGTLHGVIGALESKANMMVFSPIKFGGQPLDYVTGLTATDRNLCFLAQRKYGPVLGYVNKTGENKLYILPGKRPGSGVFANGDPEQRIRKVYFMIHNNDSTHMMEWDGMSQPVVYTTLDSEVEITGSTWAFGQQIFSLSNGLHANLFQVNGKHLLEQNVRYISNPNYVTSNTENLVYLASEMNREYLYTSIPLVPPLVGNSSFTVFNFWPNHRKVGQVMAESVDGGRLRYKIVSGNEGEAFKIDEFSGEMRVNNKNHINSSGNNIYHIGVEVSEKRKGSSIANVDVLVKYARPFSRTGLRETLLFFPDFSKANTLTTTKLPDGETVMVYDLQFNMVDILMVENGEIVLGSYTPGMYLLNVRNKENLYQKIELQ